MTQTHGPWSGHLFDTKDMKPLTGVAFEQAIAWLEEQVKYAPDDEFDKCVELNTEYMNSGECVLTYNWGNSFKRYLEEGSNLLGGKFGVAPTPGSTKVLDRDAMELVECNEERCKYGDYFEDIGWVNRAPYLAYGGYACSVNNYTDPLRKRFAMEFCSFAASTKESLEPVIPNATVLDETLNGQDPFRYSHLDLAMFVQQGYERETAEDYIDTIRASLDSRNAVIDNRFPTAADLETVVRREVPKHLIAARDGLIPVTELVAERKQLLRNIENQWQEIIADYTSLPTTRVPILESYQRLRNIYSPDINQNYLGNIRSYGYVLVAISIGGSLLSVAWVVALRKTRIVQASQPFFLVLISIGVAVLGSSIIPIGFDEEIASAAACSRACMSIPWLLAMGWTIIFAAIFSKLQRINMVFGSASRFRRVAVTEKDVLHFFAILLVMNLALLLTWTFVAPLQWTRVQKSKTESYGTCAHSGNDTAWNTIVALTAVVNGAALVLSNVAAYRARKIATEYSESRYIAMAMLSILQIVLVAVPVLFLVDDQPVARYFLMSTVVFVLCMTVLLWMFVPKVMAWRAEPKEKKTRDHRRTISPGLEFRLRRESYFGGASSAGDATLLRDYQLKLAALESIMQEQGIDARSLFKEAGLGDHCAPVPQSLSGSFGMPIPMLRESIEQSPGPSNVISSKNSGSQVVEVGVSTASNLEECPASLTNDS